MVNYACGLNKSKTEKYFDIPRLNNKKTLLIQTQLPHCSIRFVYFIIYHVRGANGKWKSNKLAQIGIIEDLAKGFQELIASLKLYCKPI